MKLWERVAADAAPMEAARIPWLPGAEIATAVWEREEGPWARSEQEAYRGLFAGAVASLGVPGVVLTAELVEVPESGASLLSRLIPTAPNTGHQTVWTHRSSV